MMKKTMMIAAAILLSAAAAQTACADAPAPFQLDNDLNCTLNKGYTVPQLYAFQKSWMDEARKHGFGKADYKTRIYFPIYSDDTSANPVFFVWRGQFNNGAVWGRLADWYLSSPWAAKFAEVMNCGKASLWIAPVDWVD
jgi:hypothetical protein